ncbi:MAG: sigma-54-dependent Fis family transcriptional regulator [Acidobacteria bacterium]|nr:MAG: sigma-54-dependent Fis family transcriptional regulator [Acidobacteriota bacterium]PYQ64979.1 MAG: sigma-54-dependent Fis family transcriptional regulator [Acidobacteriota bacterium]
MPSNGSGATRRMRRAASPPPPEESDRASAGRRPSLKSLFRTRSRSLEREIAMLGRALDLPTTILIQGDSGTGKDRLARALHDASNRRGRPFVRVEAANLSDDLFESELFGHERGAFTGAVSGKRGLLEVAGDGTVYLDEVSSLSLAGQAKFLRVLQERTFRRLGGVVVHPFRARLVVSSRRDLSELVREKGFRDDFFYRIDVVSVRLPRLSDRPEDILPLARQCLKESARDYGRPARRFSRDAEELLARHPWPGNVRELFHVVQKAALTADGPIVSAADLPSGELGSVESILGAAVERRWTLKELSNAYIEETLRRAGGNRSLAAKRLGVSRKFLWERAKKK